MRWVRGCRRARRPAPGSPLVGARRARLRHDRADHLSHLLAAAHATQAPWPCRRRVVHAGRWCWAWPPRSPICSAPPPSQTASLWQSRPMPSRRRKRPCAPPWRPGSLSVQLQERFRCRAGPRRKYDGCARREQRRPSRVLGPGLALPARTRPGSSSPKEGRQMSIDRINDHRTAMLSHSAPEDAGTETRTAESAGLAYAGLSDGGEAQAHHPAHWRTCRRPASM